MEDVDDEHDDRLLHLLPVATRLLRDDINKDDEEKGECGCHSRHDEDNLSRRRALSSEEEDVRFVVFRRAPLLCVCVFYLCP